MILNQIRGELFRKILCAYDRVPEYRLAYAGSYNNEVVEDIVKRINNGELDGEISAELVEEVLSGVKKGDTALGPGVYTDKIKWGIHEIEVRPEGKGYWGQRIKQSDSRVDAYELKINPYDESYYLSHPEGGYVQFENIVNDTVQDGKLVMQQKFFYHVYDMPDFAKNKVLEEAQRQIDAAELADYKIEWLVSDEDAVSQLIEFFKEKNVDIIVSYYPE